MARITVSDCEKVVRNRFELVVLASQRARHLSAGAKPTIEKDNDRNTVIALREIAGNKVDINLLEESILATMSQSFNENNGISQSLGSDTSQALTGEIDTDEAILDSEFAAIERKLNIADTVNKDFKESEKALKEQMMLMNQESEKELKEQEEQVVKVSAESEKELKEQEEQVAKVSAESEKELKEQEEQVVKVSAKSEKELKEQANQVVKVSAKSEKELKEQANQVVKVSAESEK